MAGAAFPIIGAAGGMILGGGMQAAIMGANLGAAAYSAFSPAKNHNVRLPTTHGARLSDLRVQLSAYGRTIPKLYGTIRLSGNVIWATNIREVVTEHHHHQVVDGGGKGGGRPSTVHKQTTVTYSYFVSLAIALCQGEVDEVTRVWADSKLLTEDILRKAHGRFNVHLGSEDQLPDDIIGRYKPYGTYPAYRGLCYVVIDDFPLEQFGNRIPNFSFEVKRSVRFKPAVEEKIKEIVLIPGAGEFVYADNLRSKQQTLTFAHGRRRYKFHEGYLNMHNYAKKPNALLALEQMAKSLPNLQWVALVVTWFATSSTANDCRIVPKVEYYRPGTVVLPTEWQVAGITRQQAEHVLRFNEDTPTYGGTPSDDTVVAICQQLKARGLNVMLYPMIFVDEIVPNPKPWRGRITATSAAEINNWFNAPDGYNRFILHYANLTKNYIDAFIIGSEMVGLTSFSDTLGSYPAVGQFINLAAMVKWQLNPQTLVTYAADWTEYHHADGGWFNLDPLWASPNIDVVGIDAYFPLTEDLPQSTITEGLIKAGWESGEGFDYYWNHNRSQKHYFADEFPHEPYKYAWKNLEYWWGNFHINPDGAVTAWMPKSKPVWFTEFGFPSVDGCANQPNVFYDPTSSESFFPRGSKGRVNFLAQREALNATLDYLEERTTREGCANLIPKRFLWTYDARPFPYWPDFKGVWQDSILWHTGHWVNGKLGMSSLGAIIAELLEYTGLKNSDYDVTRLTSNVQGYIITDHQTAREAIEQLQAAYFFDVVESDGILKFVPRTAVKETTDIREEELVPSDNPDIKQTLEITIAQELELPQKISLTYIDQLQNYDLGSVESQRQTVQTREKINFSLGLVLGANAAKEITDITLYNAWQERMGYGLTLPPKYALLEPTDVINVIAKTASGNINHQMRIVKTSASPQGMIKIFATSFNLAMYDFHSQVDYQMVEYELPEQRAETILELIDAPPLPNDNMNQAIVRIAAIGSNNNWSGATIYKSNNDGYDYQYIASVETPSVFGVSVSSLLPASPLIFDQNNEIIIRLLSGSLNSVTELVLLNGANASLLGDELIQFQNAELIDENTYRLTKLLRGRQGTEWAINNHGIGDRFVLLNSGLYGVNMHNSLIDRKLAFKAVSLGSSLEETEPTEFTFTARNLKPFAPVHAKATKDVNNNIIINWIRRSRIDNEWRPYTDIPLGEEEEKYQIEIRNNAQQGNDQQDKNNNQLIRTFETTQPSVTYTIEDQLADANLLAQNLEQANLTATIYQLSNRVGRGYGTSVAI